MGWFDWFDDTTIYSAGISITHLVPKLPESPVKAAVLGAILNDGSIVNNLIVARDKTMFSKAEDLLAYGNTGYYRGLPANGFPGHLGQAIPILPIRENGLNVAASGNAVAIDTTDKALSIVGLDIDSVTAGINSSPSLGSINDAYILFGFNPRSQTPGTSEYFFRFVQALYDPVYNAQWWQGYSYESAFNQYVWNHKKTPLGFPIKTFYIIMGPELSFKVEFITIDRIIFNGVIGPVNTYTHHTELYFDPAFGYSATADIFVDDLWESFPELSVDLDKFVVRRQISATQFEQFGIYGLAVTNNVKVPGNDKRVFHTIDGFHLPTLGWADRLNGNSATFVIPLLKGIMDQLDPFVQEQFLADSLIMYIHSIDSTNIPWYQSEGFLDFVGAVISIIPKVLNITSGSTSFDLTALIKQVAISVILGIASEAIFEALVPIVGEAAAAAILGISAAIAVNFAYNNIEGLKGLPWADTLLKSSEAIIDTLNEGISAESEKFAEEYKQFTEQAEITNEELEEATDLLGNVDDSLLSSVLSVFFDASETPTDFFDRTIHQGNVGTIGIDAISNYVDNSLRLPKANGYDSILI